MMPVVPMLFCAFACIYDNGGQKCWDLSSDITKTSDPSPPTPNKVEFGAKWVKLSAFLGHNTARGSGGDNGMNPKPNKKLSLGAESYGTIAWKRFFTQSKVLLSSIVPLRKQFVVMRSFCFSSPFLTWAWLLTRLQPS